jgi:hypothetical protein
MALGTAVLVLPMRAPVLHAKMLASLDHLAGGRFILGALHALCATWQTYGRIPPGTETIVVDGLRRVSGRILSCRGLGLSPASAEALQLAINRVAVLSRQDMPAAADTLMQLKERGVDHAILVVAPGETAVTSLLQEFAETYLADVQA